MKNGTFGLAEGDCHPINHEIERMSVIVTAVGFDLYTEEWARLHCMPFPLYQIYHPAMVQAFYQNLVKNLKKHDIYLKSLGRFLTG